MIKIAGIPGKCQIEFEPVDLLRERVIKHYQFYLKIEPNHLEYRVHWDCEQPEEDEGLPWVKLKIDSKLFTKRESIMSSELKWSNDNQCWLVLLNVIGMDYNIMVPFKERPDALKLFEELNQWIYG